MSYRFHALEWYCIEAAHFFCAATHIPYNQAAFDQAVQAAGAPTVEDGMVAVLDPLLQAIGFGIGTWNPVVLGDEYVDYVGFRLEYGGRYIVFQHDDFVTVTENYPDSVTFEFSDAAKNFFALMKLDGGFDPLAVIRVERVGRDTKI